MTTFQKVLALGVVGVIVVVGVLAYRVFRTPEAASAPLTAIPLAASSPIASGGSQDTASAATTAAASSSGPAAAVTTDAAASTGGTTAASTPIVAQIVPDESEARFIIDEVLNNAPNTVIGTTKQVAGEIAVDPQDPTKTRVGVIQVNARTLTTDNDFRNRAIKNQILQTNQYEVITFTPTELVGLPQSGAVGQTYTFQIKGNLTIRDVTKPVTFDVTVTPTSTTRLQGTAKATIRYADWGITIPQVRQVASVSDQVRLEIDVVAVPK